MRSRTHRNPNRIQANIQMLKRRLHQVIPQKTPMVRGKISHSFNKKSNVALVKKKMITTLIMELERCLSSASGMQMDARKSYS